MIRHKRHERVHEGQKLAWMVGNLIAPHIERDSRPDGMMLMLSAPGVDLDEGEILAMFRATARGEAPRETPGRPGMQLAVMQPAPVEPQPSDPSSSEPPL